MTKIYSADTKLSSIDTSKIEDKLYKTKKHSTFYTDNGIFSIDNSILVKHIINDSPLIKHKIDNNSFVVDKSTVIKEKHNYQLPYGYIVQRTEQLEYKLCDTSEVKLIIIMENGYVIDTFFKTSQDYTHPEVENAITTFLSLLNFY